MYRRLAVLAGALALLCATPLCAQEAVLGQMYGSGVHAYFSADYQRAYDDLTAAVDAGTTDPRCFYFRGLCFLKLGREEEANMDFEQAARLESEDVNKFYNVPRALERIQGSTRLIVEQHRAQARLDALKRAEELRQQRYGELRDAERRVLETQAEAAPAVPLEVPAPPEPATVADPLGLGPTQATTVGPDNVPAAPATAEVTAPAEPAETPAAPDDPFATVPAPAMTDQDPFAAQPMEEPAAEPAAGREAPAASAGGVFGALGKAIGKAVTGDEEPEEPGEAGVPAPAGMNDDPFAPSERAAPGAEAPAAAAEDPFAPAEPAAPAGMDDDPLAPAEPAAAAEPPAPAAMADDPFAPAEPAAADAEAPAAADENPFMEEEKDDATEAGEEAAPAEKKEAAPADDDPFA